MALLPNSYGDTGEIAALVPRYANADTPGVFDAVTTPLLLVVESLTDQISGLLNSILAKSGFSIPVTNADVKLMLDIFVNQEVAAIAEGVNGSGRFGPTRKQVGRQSRFVMIMDDVQEFVAGNELGMERLGAARDQVTATEILTRDTDEAGDTIHPIFQRKAFGNVIANWDQ